MLWMVGVAKKWAVLNEMGRGFVWGCIDWLQQSVGGAKHPPGVHEGGAWLVWTNRSGCGV